MKLAQPRDCFVNMQFSWAIAIPLCESVAIWPVGSRNLSMSQMGFQFAFSLNCSFSIFSIISFPFLMSSLSA